MSRPLRLSGYIAIGIVAGLLIAGVGIWLLTRTDWGMERARRFAVGWLDERIEGELRLSRISGGGLLGGVIIHDFGIVDPGGRPFLSTDSMELSYDWKTLVGGRIVLNRVVLHRPTVALEKLPGDSLWNYEYVFPDTSPGPSTADRDLIMFRRAEIHDGTAYVRMALDPADIDEPSDTARLVLERVGGGLVRTMRFDQLEASLDRVIWESPVEKGRLFEIASVQGRGFVWREPFHITDARGTLTMRDSVVSFDMARVELPSSRASLLGTVIRAEGRNRVDLRVDGEEIVFRDLEWLYPSLPEEGGGSLDLRIQSQPAGGTLFLARDARLTAPGTRVAGTFGVVVGDSLYFTQVDLRASPLDVSLIERMLPGGLPVDGLLIGTVEVSGPLSALETRGDMRLAGAADSAGSAVSWRGVLDVRRGQLAAHALTADVTELELALLTALNPALALTGRVTGHVEGDGRPDRFRFTAALEHASSDGGRTGFDGGGTLEGGGRSRRIDLTLNASSVTLQDLSTYVPALRGMQGELAGPVHVQGTVADFGFTAAVASEGGPIALDGRVTQLDNVRRVTASASAQGFRLHALWPRLPATAVSGELTLDVTGESLTDATGTVALRLDSARVRDLPNARLELFGTLADGVLSVDSSLVRSIVGVGRATGTVALVVGRQGVLDAVITSESLTPLEPYLFDDPAASEAPEVEPRLAGSLDATARLTGWLGDLDLSAEVRGEALVFGGLEAQRMRVTAELSGLRAGDARFSLTGFADSVAIWSHPVQTARLDAVGRADSVVIALTAADARQDKLAGRAVVHRRTPDSTDVRMEELRIGGAAPWRLAAAADATLADGRLQLGPLELNHATGGRARASGRLGWAGAADGAAPPLDFSVALTGVPFTELLRAVRSGEEGAGAIEGHMRVSGTALAPLLEAELTARDVLYGDVRIDRAFAELTYAARAVDMHVEAQHGGRSILTGGGRIPLDLRLLPLDERRLARPLTFALTADSLPPALPLGLLSGFANVTGRIDGTANLGGTTLDPALSGGFDIRNAAADWNVSGVRYRDVNGRLVLEGDRVIRVDVAGLAVDPRTRTAAGGGTTISGTLDFQELTDPRFDLRFTADRAWAAGRRDVEASVTGEVRMGGRYTRPEISGALAVEQGALYIDELYRQYLIVGLELDDPSLLSMVDTSLVAVRPLLAASKNPFLRGLQVRDLDLAVGADSWLRSRDMDVEVTGSIGVAFDRRDEDLRLSGTLNVERGTYTLYYPPLQSRRFQVRLGTIEFPGTPGIDPNLSITAAYKARAQGEPLDVLAIVSGTLQNPRASLASDAEPPISESDLASYLFFGVPTWEMGNAGTGMADVRAVAGLGFRALGPSVLGYASSGLQTLVQSAGLLDYVSLTSAELTPVDQQTTGLSRMLAGTQLELGRYLHSSVFFGYTQRLGTGRYDPAVRLEWRFLPEFSLELFAEDRLARTPGFGVRQETGLRKVYGFSLFREWGY